MRLINVGHRPGMKKKIVAPGIVNCIGLVWFG